MGVHGLWAARPAVRSRHQVPSHALGPSVLALQGVSASPSPVLRLSNWGDAAPPKSDLTVGPRPRALARFLEDFFFHV